MDDATQAWLILLRTPGLGAAALQRLVGAAGNAPGAALERLRREPGPLDPEAQAWLKAPDTARLAADMAWLAAPARRLLTFLDADFPPLLGQIPDPPAALFVAGQSEWLLYPQAAVVGARSATPAGLATARSLARGLGTAGFVVTSGMADGIDGAAHRAALDAGLPTVAVVGTGLEHVYPAKHRDLAERLATEGAIVSEFPLDTPARPAHFPMRNRLICGLSLGAVVVEAGLRSGSLITARLAGEQGREVFAVPGSIHNPLARGCNKLIRDGASLVESAADVVEVLAPAARALGLELRERLQQGAAEADTDDPARPRDRAGRRLLKALGYDPARLDELVERTGQDVGALASQLLMLELEGLVQGLPGNRYQRMPASRM